MVAGDDDGGGVAEEGSNEDVGDVDDVPAGAARRDETAVPAGAARGDEAAGASQLFHRTGSKAEDIDVVMTAGEMDVERQQQALDCHVTYAETIEQAGARRNIPREAVFEIYQEAHDPPLESLFEGLAE